MLGPLHPLACLTASKVRLLVTVPTDASRATSSLSFNYMYRYTQQKVWLGNERNTPGVVNETMGHVLLGACVVKGKPPERALVQSTVVSLWQDILEGCIASTASGCTVQLLGTTPSKDRHLEVAVGTEYGFSPHTASP